MRLAWLVPTAALLAGCSSRQLVASSDASNASDLGVALSDGVPTDGAATVDVMDAAYTRDWFETGPWDLSETGPWDLSETEPREARAESDLADASHEAGDWFCPGHREPCLAGNCGNYFLLGTADGSLSIVSVVAVSGFCSVDEIASPAGQPLAMKEGGVPPSRSLVIFVGGGCPVVSATCLFRVGFANGSSLTIAETFGPAVTFRAAFCIDNSNCCDSSKYYEGTYVSCNLTPLEYLVDVPIGIDGGAAIDSGGGVDGGNSAG
jgi:hypothetical protein